MSSQPLPQGLLDPPSQVAYTLEGQNSTLFQGRELPAIPNFPAGAVFDSKSNQVIVGSGDGNEVFALNSTTADIIAPIPLPPPSVGGADPEGFAIDPVHDVLWAAELGAGVAAVNLTTDTFVKDIPADGPIGITYDTQNRYIYTIGFASGLLTAINTTTESPVANKTVHGASSITYDPLSDSLYLTDPGSGTILVVSPTTMQVLARISPGTFQFSPWDSIYDSDSGTIVVAGGTNVSIVNATTNQLVSSNASVDVGGLTVDPEHLAFNSLNHEIYVAPAGRVNGSGVAALDSRTGAYLREIWTDGSRPSALADAGPTARLFAFSGAQLTLINSTDDGVANLSVPLVDHFFGAAFDPDNGLVYVARNDPSNGCSIPGALTIVRPSFSPTIVGSIPVGNGPQQVGVDPAHHRVFVTNLCSNTISALNDVNDSIVNSSVSVGSGPEGIAIDPARGTVYVSDVYDNSIWTVNESTLASSRLLNFSNGTQPAALAFDPIDSRLFIAQYGSSNVSVLNTTSNTLLPTILHVGAYPQGLLYDGSNGLLYVACSGSSNLSVISAAAPRVVGSILTDAGPVSLALDPSAGILYVDAFNAGSVDLIRTSNNTLVSGSVRVGTSPIGVAYVPGTNQVDVADEQNGTISVLANAPQISDVRLSPGSLEAGVQASLAIGVVNGTPPYATAVNSTDGVCSGNLPVYTCGFPIPGPAQLRIRVTDGTGYAAWANSRVSVATRLTALTLNSSVSALDVGQSVRYSMNWAGGVRPVSLSYFGLPGGCMPPAAYNWTCAPNAAGTYELTVLANDSDGVYASTSAALTVYPALEVESFRAPTSTYVVGQRILFTTAVIGGLGPYGYAYGGLPPGCTNSNDSLLSCVPRGPGNFTIQVSVEDSLGEMRTANTTVLIGAYPALGASIVAAPQNPIIGQAMSIVVVVTGGAPPYAISFLGLPSSCPSSNATVVLCGSPAAGSYVVTVDVTDSLNQRTSASTLFSVAAGCSTSSGSCGISPLDVELLALAAGAAAAVAVFGFDRWGRRRGPSGGAAVTPANPATPISPKP